MPTLKISIPHNLSQQEALDRIQKLVSDLKTQHKDKITVDHESWDNNTGHLQFNALGNKISGTVKVEQKSIDIAADVPLMVSLFEGKIRKMIEEESKKLLK